jgi:hypothetical protein
MAGLIVSSTSTVCSEQYQESAKVQTLSVVEWTEEQALKIVEGYKP